MARLTTIRLCGWIGLLGAVLVGIGEGLIQYSSSGDLAGYSYLSDIPLSRQSLGHWIAVFAAPLYLPGYWFLSQQFPKDKKLAATGFAMMAYAFVIGAVWMGGRIDLALTSHGIKAGQSWLALQEDIAAHHEPLVNVLRVAVFIWSGFWIWSVGAGRSHFPRWMVLVNPALILGSVFGLWFITPAIGNYILPTAMNVTHILLFGLALLTTRDLA